MNVTLLMDLHLVLADTFMFHVSANLNESGKSWDFASVLEMLSR